MAFKLSECLRVEICTLALKEVFFLLTRKYTNEVLGTFGGFKKHLNVSLHERRVII